MGVRGAALATVLSQMASCAFVLLFLFSKKVPIRISFGGYEWRIIRKITVLGMTPFLIIAFDNVLIITLNAALQPVSYTHLDVYKRQDHNTFNKIADVIGVAAAVKHFFYNSDLFHVLFIGIRMVGIHDTCRILQITFHIKLVEQL